MEKMTCEAPAMEIVRFEAADVLEKSPATEFPIYEPNS